jgi:hypothetical protein
VLFAYFRFWRPLRKDYRELIEPELVKHGYELQSIRRPPFWSRGPFPLVQVRWGGVYTQTPFGSGEYWVMRVVQARDAQGRPVTLWFQLYFQAFRFKDLQWKEDDRPREKVEQ